MDKVQLTSLVRSIAKRKLMEIGERPKPAMGKPISSINWGGAPKSASKRQHGLVVGQEGGEPMIQVVGYGVAKLSSVKKSIADRIEVLAKEAKVGNFKNIEHDLHPDGVLVLFVKALNEVEEQLKSGGSVKEDVTTTTTSSTNSTGVTDPNAPETTTPTEPQEPQMSDLDAKALQMAQADQTKLTSDRDRLRGALAKLQEPIIKKTKDAQRKMADIEKKLGNASKKIQDIQAKYKTN